jgi:hypothetical protein
MQILVDIPDVVSRENPAALAERARLLLVIDEVRAGRVSRAGAARALGLTLDAFLVTAGEHGLYAIDQDLEDFVREVEDTRERGF